MTHFFASSATIARISSPGVCAWTDLTPPEWRDRTAQAAAES